MLMRFTHRQIIPALTLFQFVGRHVQIKLRDRKTRNGVVEMESKGYKPAVDIFKKENNRLRNVLKARLKLMAA